MLQEPTLERYFYYLRRVEGDTAQEAQEHRAAFEQELGSLLAHIERLSGQVIPPWQWLEEDNSRRASQLIGNTDWLDSTLQTGRSCFAAAYIYGDMYCLQVGYCQSGEAGPEVFAKLQKAAWKPSTSEHLLGSSSYLCGIAAGKDEELAAQALGAFTGGKPEEIISTYLCEFDSWLYGASEQPYATALFYPDAEREKQAGDALLNQRIPRLEVYKHKIDRQLIWCEQNLALLSAQSRAMGGLLDEFDIVSSEGGISLARRLTRQFRVYEGSLETLSERQTTVETNLHNLKVVLGEFGPFVENRLLKTVQKRLRKRGRQFTKTLDEATQVKGWAETAIKTIVTRLGLQRPADLLEEADESVQAEGLIRQGYFPGVLPPYEAGLPLPQIEIDAGLSIHLEKNDINILRHVYRGYKTLHVLKKFYGGATCRHALLTRPIGNDGYEKALRVTKISATLELATERDNYRQVVADSLPFFTAPLEWERYYAKGNLAGLSYFFVGGGGLGETMELEKYYQQAEADQNPGRISGTLNGLLDHELGELWYGKFHVQENRSLEAEYSPKLFEHLRLRLRPASSDALWARGKQPRKKINGYQRIEAADIPNCYRDIQPGTLLAFDGLVVNEFRKNVAVLWDKQGQGIVVRVELSSRADMALGQSLGAEVGVRGEVVYNRHGRMEEVVRALFPTLSPGIESKTISLPSVAGTFPDPLYLYPELLKKKLPEFRRSYVHGDLHMRNVLVDGWGIGRLIDFAEVGERHNLFDFIRLEGYLRYLTLGSLNPPIPLQEYVHFEESLTAATLGKNAPVLQNPQLGFAHEVILDIRGIVRKYLSCEKDLANIYLPALFLHCLGFTRYDQKSNPHGIQLTFATACVLGRELV